MAPKCGVITFEVDRIRSGPATLFDVNAYMNGKTVGRANLAMLPTSDNQRFAIVSNIGVASERCGVGTRLYQKLYKIACKNRAIFASDNQRTEASEGFWRKQEKKGRAVCNARDSRGIRLKASGFTYTPIGRWPCHSYRMKKTCPKSFSLRGR